jgi:hypothetical protein
MQQGNTALFAESIQPHKGRKRDPTKAKSLAKTGHAIHPKGRCLQPAESRTVHRSPRKGWQKNPITFHCSPFRVPLPRSTHHQSPAERRFVSHATWRLVPAQSLACYNPLSSVAGTATPCATPRGENSRVDLGCREFVAICRRLTAPRRDWPARNTAFTAADHRRQDASGVAWTSTESRGCVAFEPLGDTSHVRETTRSGRA